MSRFDELEARIAALENKADYLGYGSDFFRFGKDVSAPGSTGGAVALVDATYNGDDHTAGDFIIAGRLYVSNTIHFGQNEVDVGNGNIDLDDTGGAGGPLRATDIYIASSTGAFTIRGIARPALINYGQLLFITNITANNMTIANFGSPAAGYDPIETFTGADESSTTAECIAVLKWNVAGGRWDLVSIRG